MVSCNTGIVRTEMVKHGQRDDTPNNDNVLMLRPLGHKTKHHRCALICSENRVPSPQMTAYLVVRLFSSLYIFYFNVESEYQEQLDEDCRASGDKSAGRA